METNETSRFLTALFAPYNGEGWAELRALPRGEGAPRRAWGRLASPGWADQAAEWLLARSEEGFDAYLGVLPRRERCDRSRKDNVLGAAWLFADLDLKGVTPEEARRAMGEADPGIVVETGGGWHCYSPLRDVMPFENGNLATYERALRTYQARLRADRTPDATRILRAPGTRNHKPERGGFVVRLERLEPWAKTPAARRADTVGGRRPRLEPGDRVVAPNGAGVVVWDNWITVAVDYGNGIGYLYAPSLVYPALEG